MALQVSSPPPQWLEKENIYPILFFSIQHFTIMCTWSENLVTYSENIGNKLIIFMNTKNNKFCRPRKEFTLEIALVAMHYTKNLYLNYLSDEHWIRKKIYLFTDLSGRVHHVEVETLVQSCTTSWIWTEPPGGHYSTLSGCAS